MRLIENKTMTTSGDFRKLIRGSGTEAFRRDKAAEPRWGSVEPIDSNRHRLRSSSSSQLVIRRTLLSTVGDRAFPVDESRL